MDKPVFLSEIVTAAKDGEEAAWKFFIQRMLSFLICYCLTYLGKHAGSKRCGAGHFFISIFASSPTKKRCCIQRLAKKILLYNCYHKKALAPRHLDIVPFAKDEWWEDEIEKRETIFL
jgi:hypothetical protein